MASTIMAIHAFFLALLLFPAAQGSAERQLQACRRLLEQGQDKAAEDRLRNYLAAYPGSDEAAVLHAVALTRLTRPKDAASELVGFLKTRPGSIRVLQAYAGLLAFAFGDNARARAVAGHVQKLHEEEYRRMTGGRSLREQLRKAESMMENQRLGEASSYYEDIIRILPLFSEPYFALGVCRSQTGRPAVAEAAFRKYVALQPWSGDGLAALGTLLVQQGREKEALTILQLSLKLDPDQPDVRKTLAQAYIGAVQYREAIGELERVLGSGGKADAQLYLLLARSHLLLVDEPRAMQAIDRGVREFPDSPEFWRGMAALLFEYNPEGDMTERTMRQLVSRFPRDAASRTLFADWAYKKEDVNSCRQALEAAGRLNPDETVRIRILALSAMADTNQDRMDEAERLFRESYAINRRLHFPDRPSAMAYVEFLEKYQREQEAQQCVREILVAAPGLPAARFSRARYLAKSGHTMEAITEAEIAFAHAGSNRDLLRTLHAFLARTYFAVGRTNEAQAHQAWIEDNSRR